VSQHERLNKQGRISNRVVGRPYKKVRYIKDNKTGETKQHPLDMMVIGQQTDGTPIKMNTTGSFGTQGTFGTFLTTLVPTKGKTVKYEQEQTAKAVVLNESIR